MPPLVIHRRDALNTGDMSSCPAQYFTWLKDAEVIDIVDVRQYDLTDRDVILGGGGLFYDPFAPFLKHILMSHTRSLTLWGIGRNHHEEHGHLRDPDGFCRPELTQKIIDKADMVGIRDQRLDPKWVPCPSVFHYSFQHNLFSDSGRGILALQHREERFHFPVDPAWKQFTMSGNMRDILTAIDEAEVVLSSSYHGCLWASWMGKKVIAVDGFSQKFRTGLPESVANLRSSDLSDLDSVLSSITPQDRLLEQAKMRGFAFAFDVAKLVGMSHLA